MKKAVGMLFFLGALTTQAGVVTITNNVVADTEIKQHVNYQNKNYGTATAAYVGRWDTRYQNPVEAPNHWMLLQWDLSSLLGADVTGATLQLQMLQYGTGTSDVYVVDSGAWTETGVTWNNWVPTETDTLLGSMTSVAVNAGLTTFSSTALTTVVQDWVDGGRPNLGLVFKWKGPAPSDSGGEHAVGDNFATRENTGGSIAPRLVIDYVPGPKLTITTNSAVADTQIDQHVDRADKNYGTNTSARVGRLGDAYTNPVVGPQTWMLIRWDLSEIVPNATIEGVSFNIQQSDSAVETTDIYAIDSGSWSELGATWNSYESGSTDSYIGNMVNQPISSGVTTFSNTNLTALVQAWVDGNKENLGIVLKYPGSPASGTTSVGDTFLTREKGDGYIAPQLVVSYAVLSPEPAILTMACGAGTTTISSTNLMAAAENQLQGKLSLSDPAWNNLGAPVTGVSETNWIVGASNPASFYRVESSK